MDLSRPLSVVTPTVDGDVLSALALADAWFTTGRLHRTIGRHSEDGVRRTLRRLVEQGVVSTQDGGNAVLFRLNRQHLAAPSIVTLANAYGELVRKMSTALAGWTTPPTFAALFGSAATGRMRIDSDIDVFVVRPALVDPDGEWAEAVSTFERDVTAWTGNDAHVLEMTDDHIRTFGAAERVLVDVASTGVPLVGELTWLTRLLTLARRHA